MLTIDPHSGIEADQVEELDLGVRPSPAGSGELLLHTEGPNAVLVLLVNHPDNSRAGPAIVTFLGCRQSIFGYPNDEAQWGDPRLRGRGYGFFEVRNSPWPARLDAYNRQAFPTRTVPRPVRHFGVACHESLGEFLAEDVRVQHGRIPSRTRFARPCVGCSDSRIELPGAASRSASIAAVGRAVISIRVGRLPSWAG